MFKSYYVVWKPEEIEADEEENQRFKSYYVVWKRHRICLSFQGKKKFKSYYVVWKRRRPERQNIFTDCLNRTM